MKTIIINNNIFQNHRNESLAKINEVYSFLELLEDEYPNFSSWFFSKIINDITSSRSLVIKIHKKRVIGVSILKNHNFEKKICTFRIAEEYQGLGIGTSLMNESIQILRTSSPLITVSENRIAQFKPLLRKFNFQLQSINSGYYQEGITEFSYNGHMDVKTPHNTLA